MKPSDRIQIAAATIDTTSENVKNAFAAHLATLTEAIDHAAAWEQQQTTHIAHLNTRIGQLETDLATACRWRERFRAALHAYLQEREQIGP